MAKYFVICAALNIGGLVTGLSLIAWTLGV